MQGPEARAILEGFDIVGWCVQCRCCCVLTSFDRYQNVLSKEVATSGQFIFVFLLFTSTRSVRLDPALGFLRRRVLLLLSCWSVFRPIASAECFL